MKLGGWAAGMWEPWTPLPTTQSACGVQPSLALSHQTHSIEDASSEPTRGGGGQQSQAPKGPGKGQLERSPMAIWAQSAPSTAVPSKYSSHPSLTLFCSVKACSYIPLTQATGQPNPNGTSIETGTHTLRSMYTTSPECTQLHTNTGALAHTDTQRCMRMGPTHTIDAYTQTQTCHPWHVSMPRHHMKSYKTPPPYRHCTDTSDPPTRDRHTPPTLDYCTYRLTHTSLVSALSPRKLWKAGHLPEFSLLQVVESEPRMQYEWWAGDSEEVVMPASALQSQVQP